MPMVIAILPAIALIESLLSAVVADATLDGPVSIGGGDHGVALTVDSSALVAALGATVADVTDPVG